MGRRRSDSEEEVYKSRRKKKRRSRSRSNSSSDSSRRGKSKKKSKKSRKRRSRSNSVSRRSRSRSYSPRSKYSSRVSSPRRRSRSTSPRHRSRSPRRRSISPRRRSISPRRRSKSPRRRSRSRSRTPRRYTRSPRRSRSPRRRSRSPRRSRSRSPNHRRRSRSRSKSKRSSRGSSQVKVEPGKPVHPSKQAELKLQQALRAAAIADGKLKDAGLLPEGVGRSMDEVQQDLRERHDQAAGRAAALQAIEDDGFAPSQFISSRDSKPGSGNIVASHENAIFGSLPLDLDDIDPATILKAGPLDPKAIMHPNLYVPVEEKMERWRKKLLAMRNKKLEGEAM